MSFDSRCLLLYAVTDRAWTGKNTLYEQVEQALSGGVTCVQLREKNLSPDEMLKSALEVKRLCAAYGVPLIINDSVDVAMRSGADGVHVGQKDMAAGRVRELVGRDMILGVTARTPEQAVAAQEAGADYLGSGAVFGTSTKLDAVVLSREELRRITSAVTIPVIAIGGINRGNIALLSDCGIAGTAVVSGIFAAENIEAECIQLRKLAEEITARGGRT